MSLFVPIPYKDYRKCALTEGSGAWYVSYYARHPDTGKLRRVRIKVTHIHHISTIMCNVYGISQIFQYES